MSKRGAAGSVLAAASLRRTLVQDQLDENGFAAFGSLRGGGADEAIH
jgi:hypothetical protein